MADPEQVYQEVLAEEQQKGSAAPIAEGRAKAARVRAEHGSPHPKEPKWWPGAQPHLEGGEAPAEAAVAEPEPEAVAAEPEPLAAEAAPAPEPAAAESLGAAHPGQPPARPETVPGESAPQPATEPAEQAVPTRGDELAAAAAATQPEAAAVPPAPEPTSAQTPAPAVAAQAGQPPARPETPAAMHPDARPAGVSHGTTTGTRLRPEDEVTTDAQFEGQKAMYERRKMIDELVSAGVPAVSAAGTGRSGSPLLAILYVLIPLIAIGFIAGRPSSTASEEPGDGPGPGPGAVTLVAQGVAFDQTEIALPPEGATVTLDNRDTTPHNFAIYANAEDGNAFANALFDGPDLSGGDSIEYEVGAIDPGEYYFQCDLHPGTMNGTVTIE
ncbi:MAG: cupredoxin domain-containing protein [Actinomycetota bacterium]